MLRIPLPVAFCLACPMALAQLGPELPLNTSVLRIGGIAAGDVTGDGVADLLIADDAASLVYLAEGIDGREFKSRVPLAIQKPSLFDLELLDFDQDGDLDLVTFHGGFGATMRTYRNVGAREFEFVQASTIIGLELGAKEVKVVDVDSDGDLDLVLSSESQQVAGYYGVNLGGGSFVFGGPSAVSPSTNRRGVASLDMDGDGLLDLLAYDSSGMLAWWPYQGGVSFGAPVASVGQPSGASFQDIELMDLDGDGDLDVVAAARFQDVVIFENEGAGVLTFRGSVPLGSGQGANIEPVDVDLDGTLDLVTYPHVNFGGGVWAMMRGPGFSFLPGTEISSRSSTLLDSTVVDMSGDGLPDVIRADISEDVFQLQSDPDVVGGAIAFETDERRIVDKIEAVQSVRVVDWDGDGDPDILTSGRSTRDRISILENVGRERFRMARELVGGPGGVTLNLDVADVNGDGLADFVTVETGGDLQLSIHQPGGGVLTQSLGVVGSIGDQVEEGPYFRDIDSDGDMDIILARSAPDQILVFDQVSNGTFSGPRTVATGSNRIESLAVGDIDSDGWNDLAFMVAAGSTIEVRWHSGDGAGNFNFEAILASQFSSGRSLQICNLDNSPTQDLVWLNHLGRTLEYCQGRVGGAFFSPRPLATFERNPENLAISQSDVFSNPDFVVSTSQSNLGNQLVYVEWQVAQTYTSTILVEELPRSADLVLADLDLDGDEDALCAFPGAARVSWFRGESVDQLGDTYCQQPVRNSQNRFGQIVAFGTGLSAPGTIELRVQELPPSAAVLFLCGSAEALLPQAGGSAGNLCLGGALGRFQNPGQVGFTSADGGRALVADLAALPQPNGTAVVMAGERWYFQAWHRDVVAGAATSNFTNALSILFE